MIQKWTRNPHKIIFVWKKHRVHEKQTNFIFFHEHNGNKLSALQEIVKQYIEKQNKVIGEKKVEKSN